MLEHFVEELCVNFDFEIRATIRYQHKPTVIWHTTFPALWFTTFPALWLTTFPALWLMTVSRPLTTLTYDFSRTFHWVRVVLLITWLFTAVLITCVFTYWVLLLAVIGSFRILSWCNTEFSKLTSSQSGELLTVCCLSGPIAPPGTGVLAIQSTAGNMVSKSYSSLFFC